MRKYFFIITTLFGIVALFANVPTRFFIGNSEVTEQFFEAIPDSLKHFTSEFDYDTVKIKSVAFPFTHYLDSVSEPGKYVIKERSKDEIESMLNRLRSIKRDNEILKLRVGDNVPRFSLQNFKNNEVEIDLPQKGTCYLLTFWATWCGNCLVELKPEFLPSVAKEFSLYSNFRFLPICIDASPEELLNFFKGNVGSNRAYLADETFLDSDRTVNEIFACGGNIPLNVVIGTDGSIKFIHLGKISEKDDLDKLKGIITESLRAEGDTTILESL